jgi:hypothetical protein
MAAANRCCIMFCATLLMLSLAVDPEVRELRVVEAELDEVLATRPKAWLAAPAGGLVAAGLMATLVGALSGENCDFGFTLRCSRGPVPLWGQLTVGIGVTTAALGVVGMLTLAIVRAVYGPRIDRLQGERDAIIAADELERGSAAHLEDPGLARAFHAIERERRGYGMPIGLMIAGAGSLAGGVILSRSGQGAAGLGVLISGIVAAAALEGLGIWQLVSRFSANRELDRRVRELRLHEEQVAPPPPPPPLPAPPLIESRLPPAPVLLSWSVAL